MRNTSRLFGVGALALAATIGLSACSGGTPADQGGNGGGGDSATGEPQYGGSLVFLDPQAPTCFYAGGSGYYPVATILNQIGDKLTYQDPQTREISPWLATEWQISEDATEYVFTLRDDVTFSDGTPLDAETVALNFDHMGLGDTELGLASQEFITNYEASEVINEHTVKFTFSAPSPGFLQATSVVGAAIVAKSTAELPYEQQCQLENFVGTGPFTVSDIQPEQQYTLAVREDYDWAPEASEHQGRAYLDEIQMIVTPEDSVRIGALTSNQAHAVRQIQAYDFATLQSQGAELHLAPTNGVNPQFVLRPGHPILEDIQVRQALLAGTDTETAIGSVYQGQFTVATSPLSSGATGYIDLSDQLQYDPELANQLLDDAGWVVGDDGIRVKDGERLELTTWVIWVFPLNQQLAELIAEQWKLIGVDLNIEAPDQATVIANQHDALRQPVAISHVGRVDPEVLTSNFHSESSRNALATPVPELDALLDQISLLPSLEEREAAAADVQRFLIDNAYSIPLYELPQTYATAPSVHGLGWEPVGRVALYDTWLSQ